MTPYYSDAWLTVYAGDCRAVMAEMPERSVHCVVTSPPYWGLRDYGAEGQIGLEPTPEQYVETMVAVFRAVRRVLRDDGTVWLNLGSSYMASGDRQTGRNDNGRPEKDRGWAEYDITRTRIAAAGASGRTPSRPPERAPAYGSDGTGPRDWPDPGSAYPDLCDECRAARSSHTPDTLPPQLEVSPLRSTTSRDTERPGSERASLDASPLGVPASTTTQSEPLRPVSCSHCGNCGACLSVLRSSARDARVCGRKSWLNYPTFKPKDMVPIPWMVAMALQADGWYLRSDVVWSKPNPMPESVTDRPTKSHEYVFLLSKRERYFFDADAVREGFADARMGNPGKYRSTYANDPRAGGKLSGLTTGEWNADGQAAGRNLRSVWTIATQPYPGAHFATFPEALVEPCVKAGTSERGVCPDCGAPWVRVVQRSTVQPTDYDGKNAAMDPQHSARRMLANVRARRDAGEPHDAPFPAPTLTGWRPTCRHYSRADEWRELPPRRPDLETVDEYLVRVAPVVALRDELLTHYAPMATTEATVLDPFAGSGTTGRVAQRLGRRAVLIDLSPAYLLQALKRNGHGPDEVGTEPMFDQSPLWGGEAA